MSYTKKDLVTAANLTKDEIYHFLNLAKEFKALNNSETKKAKSLYGKTTVNAFFENSTRTRTSFEIAAKRLGADAMKTDIVVVRHYSSGAAKFIAENTDAHVVNAGDGLNEHPSQALLDLFTILENRGSLENLTVAIIGDIFHSRVARSNIYVLKTLGAKVKLFGPPMFLTGMEAFGCQICSDMREAIEDSDVIIMLRIQLERQDDEIAFPSVREYSKFFGLTQAKMKYAKEGVMILHPGPINRGVEINSDVADDPRYSHVLNQVENGVAVRMAILDTLIKNKGAK